MRCPHCEYPLSELSCWNDAQFQICNRCSRIWINHETLGPQGVLKSPGARREPLAVPDSANTGLAPQKQAG